MSLLLKLTATIFAALAAAPIIRPVSADIRGGGRSDLNIPRLLNSDKRREFKRKFLLKEGVDLRLQTMTRKNRRGKRVPVLRGKRRADGGEGEEFDIDSYEPLNVFSGPGVCEHNGVPKACPASTVSTGISRDGKTVLVARNPRSHKAKTLMVMGRDGKTDEHIELVDEEFDIYASLEKDDYDEEEIARQFKFGSISPPPNTDISPLGVPEGIEVHQDDDEERRMQEAEGTTTTAQLSRGKVGKAWQGRHARQNLQVGKEQNQATSSFMEMMQTPFSASSSALRSSSGRKLSTSCTTWDIIQVAIAYDSTFCASFTDEAGADAKVQEVLAAASIKYQQDGLCVQLVISHLEGWCDASSDPYKPARDTNLSGCGDPGILQEFTNYFNANRGDVIRDVAHLFVGGGAFDDPPPNTAIGCATVGVWCNLQSSYGIDRVSFSTDLNYQTVLFAHELGHNGGAAHDSTTGYIMYSSVNTAANGFSATSIAVMRNRIDTTTCVQEVPSTCTADAQCNNGDYCDGTETCDAGNTGFCFGGTPVGCDKIEAPYSSSSYSHTEGFFFDLTSGPKQTLLTSITVLCGSTNPLQVFTRPGSGSGQTSSGGAGWTEVHSGNCAGNFEFVTVYFDPPITISAGSTLGMHAFSSGGIRAYYTNNPPSVTAWTPRSDVSTTDMTLSYAWAATGDVLWGGGGSRLDPNGLVVTYSVPNDCVTDADCDNGNPCDGAETCVNLVCAPGMPIDCDDGSFCNGVEQCNPSNGQCVSPGDPCDDGNACNGIESCDETNDQCVAGTPIQCDDGVFCNGVETCDPTNGQCSPSPGDPCNDGDACNGVETCDEGGGQCNAGTALQCSDITTPGGSYLSGMNGYFFDLSAVASDVVITSIKLYTNSGGQLEVFTRPGSGSGFTNSESGWTQVYDDAAAGGSFVQATFNPPLDISSGSTLALHAYSNGGILGYWDGSNPVTPRTEAAWTPRFDVSTSDLTLTYASAEFNSIWSNALNNYDPLGMVVTYSVVSQSTEEPTSFPSKNPSSSPSKTPTTEEPSSFPSKVPSRPPVTSEPSSSPSSLPSKSPSRSPVTDSPSAVPSASPSLSPVTSEPSSSPSKAPTTEEPSASPSETPSGSPVTDKPSTIPSKSPSKVPVTSEPSSTPSKVPTTEGPSSTPSRNPSRSPVTDEPSSVPSTSPSRSPITSEPSASPSKTPTTEEPSSSPSKSPSRSPVTSEPSSSPSNAPVTEEPTSNPSSTPSFSPSASPSACLTDADCSDGLYCNGAERCDNGHCASGTPVNCDDGSSCTIDSCNEAEQTCNYVSSCSEGEICVDNSCVTAEPSSSPSASPSKRPSRSPVTSEPSSSPSTMPSSTPSRRPTNTGSNEPSSTPSRNPSRSPVTDEPSSVPSRSPSRSPVTSEPSTSPSKTPTTEEPSSSPSKSPSRSPVTSEPSSSPSRTPSQSPSTIEPSSQPSTSPSRAPVTEEPSASPSKAPVTNSPSSSPSDLPVTNDPSSSPSEAPSRAPVTDEPSSSPSRAPVTAEPSSVPSASPTSMPSKSPVTDAPSSSPSISLAPSVNATDSNISATLLSSPFVNLQEITVQAESTASPVILVQISHEGLSESEVMVRWNCNGYGEPLSTMNPSESSEKSLPVPYSVGAHSLCFNDYQAPFTIFVFDSTSGGAISGRGQMSGSEGANYIFSVKYRRNGQLSGNVFYKIDGYRFQSGGRQTALVLMENEAKLFGTGKVNGSGNYDFVLTVSDTGSSSGQGLRLEVYRRNGTLLYDNYSETADCGASCFLTMPLSKGRISIRHGSGTGQQSQALSGNRQSDDSSD